MSDTFDHELDAFEQAETMDWQLDDAAPSWWAKQGKRSKKGAADNDKGWECPHCGAWHPASHKKCFYCNDGKKKGPHGRATD